MDTLYSVNDKGKVRQWKADCKDNILHTTFGLVGGKLTTTTTTYKDNIQCQSRLNTAYNKKIRLGYSKTKNTTPTVKVPMKISNMEDLVSPIKFPVYVQYKYDGVNGMFIKQGTSLKLYSRGLKEYRIPKHLVEPVNSFMLLNNLKYLNVELWIPGTPLNKIISAIADGANTSQLVAVIFDVPDTGLDFHTRYISYMTQSTDLPLIIADTTYCTNLKEVEKVYNKALKQGYEGVVVKESNSMYRFNKRVTDVFKWKPTQTNEFTVIGHVIDSLGDPVFVCKTGDDKEFKVKPRGSKKQRRNILMNIRKYHNEQITVEFEKLSEYGIPLKPVTDGVIRDYEG